MPRALVGRAPDVDPTLSFTLVIPKHTPTGGMAMVGLVPTQTCAQSCGNHDCHPDDDNGGDGEDTWP
jgi:hypothetical protein